jgi:hypothetical protein
MRWTNEILYSSCPCRWVTKVWVPRRWPHTSIHNYRGWTVEEPLPRWMASMTRGRQGPSESLSHERIYYLSWNLLPSFLRLEFNFDSLLDTSSSFVVKSHLKRHCCPYGPTTFLPPFLSFSLFSLAHPSSLTWATAWTAPATPPPAPLSRSVPFDDGHSHLSLSHSLSLSLSLSLKQPRPRHTALPPHNCPCRRPTKSTSFTPPFSNPHCPQLLHLPNYIMCNILAATMHPVTETWASSVRHCRPRPSSTLMSANPLRSSSSSRQKLSIGEGLVHVLAPVNHDMGVAVCVPTARVVVHRHTL